MGTVLFLPEAAGSAEFWKPVVDRLPAHWQKSRMNWPGLGHEQHDPHINSVQDLVASVNAQLSEPVDLVAQSMGGWVAVQIAIERPQVVRRLVLVATSGGLDVARFGAQDWRPAFRIEYPNSQSWIFDASGSALAFERIMAPTLLIWGDSDEISPVAVGRHLENRIPNATLNVISGGDHSMAVTRPDDVAGLVLQHLS